MAVTLIKGGEKFTKFDMASGGLATGIPCAQYMYIWSETRSP
jgi:hypothetical protein